MTTRRQALAGAAAGTAAIALRAAPPAHAAGTDVALLEVLTAYQQEVVFLYELALQSGPLEGRDGSVLGTLRDQAATAAAALRKALVEKGGTPPPQKPLASAKLPPEAARKADRRGYLRAIVDAEEATLGGFYAALQALVDKRLVRGTTAFMAQGGRRLVALRELAGDPLLPRAFETGAA
jgi:hypothetical protein